MTEQEFLEKRVPFWIQGDDLEITFATGSDRNEIHSHLSKKYHYNWLFIIRGYYWPGSHVQVYQADYETPNCTILFAQYLLNYFPDINYVGFGCYKGKVGEIWNPKVCIVRDSTCINSELLSK